MPGMRAFPSPSAFLSRFRIPKFRSLNRFLLLFSTLLQTLPGFNWTTAVQATTTQDFVLLIFVHYERWQENSSAAQPLQLNSVKTDIKRVLNYLQYRHDGTSRRYYFLMDFDYEYTDLWGKTKLLPRRALPTRDGILSTVREATSDGSSGLIYYGGHCHFSESGISQIDLREDYVVYQEIPDIPRGPKAAYLICIDGGRIYGNEFYSALQDPSKNGKASTLTIVLDTCKAAAFADDFDDLQIIYSTNSAAAPLSSSQSLNQLVVVLSCQAHEPAGTYRGCGALTYFLTEYLQGNSGASAAEVVQHLNDQCQGQPVKAKRQHPQIRSRHPLRDAFTLLPGTM